MRIAYVVPFYPSFLQTYIFNELSEIQRAGHQVFVVPLHSGFSAEARQTWPSRQHVGSILPSPLFDLEVCGLALRTLFRHPLRTVLTLCSLHCAAGRNLYAHAGVVAVAPKALATAWRLRGAKVDVIHAHFATHTAACAAIVAGVNGIAFSFTAHAHDIYCTSRRLRNETLGWKLRRASQVVAVSDYASRLLRRHTPAAAERIRTVYVGIPLDDTFSEVAPLPRGNLLRMLCVCDFVEKKGLNTLIDACALLRAQGYSFRLQLHGGGVLRDALASQISRLSLDDCVILGGLIQQGEVARQMAACHFLVMPCRRDREDNMDGIPTVFMEAMAIGRPVISSPISGIPELVRHRETGLLVSPNDPVALAAAVRTLADDDQLRYDLGRRARALVKQQHDQRRNTGHLLDALTTAVRGKSPEVRTSDNRKPAGPADVVGADHDRRGPA